MTSNLQAGVHFKNALEHLHLIDMHFVLHRQLIGCMHTSCTTGIASKHFLTTSSQSVPSCHKLIVSVGLFFLIHYYMVCLKPYLSLIVCP